MGILIILLFLLEVYTAGLVIFLIIQIARKKKLPLLVILINGLCIVFLLWLKYKVEDHEIIFTGSYQKADDWGQGLANMMVTLMNLGVVYLMLLISQIVFVIFFRKEFERLNIPDKPKTAEGDIF